MWVRRVSENMRDLGDRSSVVTGVVAAGAAIGALFKSWFPGLADWQAWLIAGLALALLSMPILWARRVIAREQAQVRDSRARVRAAEVDLVEVMRGTRPGVAAAEPASKDPGVDENREPGAVSEPGPSSLRSAEQLALPELWEVTHSRLALYHEIALGQARRSFRNAQAAMVLGFALLVGFVLVALRATTTAGAIVAGGLGAVSAALAGYISRTFVKSQETAASHLRAYFEQPLEFSRFLAAERIARDGGLDHRQRAEVLTSLVAAIVAGPSAPPSGTGEPPA